MKEGATQSTAVQHALERERYFLAEELHEGLCQQLCGIALHLKVLERRLLKEATNFSGEFGDLQRSFESAIDDARFLYRTLKPPIWDVPSFVAALKELTDYKAGSFECHLTLVPEETFLRKETALGLFRIAQEALRDFRKLTVAPTWRLRLDIDEASVGMALEIDSQSYQEIVNLGLWNSLRVAPEGVGPITFEAKGSPVVLRCQAKRV